MESHTDTPTQEDSMAGEPKLAHQGLRHHIPSGAGDQAATPPATATTAKAEGMGGSVLPLGLGFLCGHPCLPALPATLG